VVFYSAVVTQDELFKIEEVETWHCHLYDRASTLCPWRPRDCPCTPGDPTPFLVSKHMMREECIEKEHNEREETNR
jgi:hypothetical protein